MHLVDQLRALVQSRAEQLVPQIGVGFLERGDAVADRHRTAAQPEELRKHEPHPVTAFSSAPQLVDDAAVNRSLRLHETFQVEGVARRFHMTTVAHMAVKRRVPRVRDLAPLIQFKRPQFDATRRRLDAALTIQDLRQIAKRRTPKAAFDYTDGAAEDELSIERARQAFRDIEFHPTILRDVTNVTAGWNVLGQPVVLPFGIAPTGFTRLMHTEGEIAGARGGGRGRDSVLTVHSGHLRDRRPGDRCSPGTEVVSAVHVA